MNKYLAFVAALALTGCVDVVSRDMEMERAAMRFSKAADDCLLDVRDKRIPYAQSHNCTKLLDRTSAAYMSSSKAKLTYIDEAVPRHAYIAESAKAVAWSAAALSNAMFRTSEPVLSLW